MQVADLIAAVRFAREQLEGERLSSMLRELADAVADEGHGAFQRKRQQLLDAHRALANPAEDGVLGQLQNLDCSTLFGPTFIHRLDEQIANHALDGVGLRHAILALHHDVRRQQQALVDLDEDLRRLEYPDRKLATSKTHALVIVGLRSSIQGKPLSELTRATAAWDGLLTNLRGLWSQRSDTAIVALGDQGYMKLGLAMDATTVSELLYLAETISAALHSANQLHQALSAMSGASLRAEVLDGLQQEVYSSYDAQLDHGWARWGERARDVRPITQQLQQHILSGESLAFADPNLVLPEPTRARALAYEAQLNGRLASTGELRKLLLRRLHGSPPLAPPPRVAIAQPR